jgi:ATP-dependent DNA helicase RecG
MTETGADGGESGPWPTWAVPGCEAPVTVLRGIGVRRAAALAGVGIETVGDLLCNRPRRYLDHSCVTAVAAAVPGRLVTVVVRILEVRADASPSHRFLLRATDGTAELCCVWFQGGRYLQAVFGAGDLVAFSGRVERFQGHLQLVHPEYEWVGDQGDPVGLHTGTVMPLYAGTAALAETGLRPRAFRALMRQAVDGWAVAAPESLDSDLRARLGLVSLAEALAQLHFPTQTAQAEVARRRLAFGELLAFQRHLAEARQARLRDRQSPVLPPSHRLVPTWRARLPFALTPAQENVAAEIIADLARPAPMQRLLQGDVGSGKTVVAVLAALTAVEAGAQVAIMAPTELLAAQHYQLLATWLEPLGLRAELLAGQVGREARRRVLSGLAAGDAPLVVGTHALLQPEVQFARLGLVIIDEQHRFGVGQRSALYRKGGCPHLLVMTATPIPRSLALTLYGDLDLSVLAASPPGRLPVRTATRPATRRPAIYQFVAEQVRAGHQAYVVYPWIEAADPAASGSVLAGVDQLRGMLPDCRVGVVHGRLPSAEKAVVMDQFVAGQVQVLATTTVVEVGVDVPAATVMVVEHAERFGLAQLHQLRGRVGRGHAQGYCILIHYPADGDDGSDSTAAAARLATVCRISDGFALAEADLEQRGAGEFLGRRQTGGTEFRLAQLPADRDLLEAARAEAQRQVSASRPVDGTP